MNDQAVLGGVLDNFRVIAVTPVAAGAGEIGVMETLAVRVVPESHGHGREGQAAGQLAGFAAHGLVVLVQYRHFHAQADALKLTAIDWQYRTTQGEAGNDVRAARYGRQAEIFLDVAVHEIEALRQ